MSTSEKQIDIIIIAKRVKSRWRLFLIVSAIAAVVASALILPVPRGYTSSAVIAPEIENILDAGSLSSIASQFGFNLGATANGDAIYPELYPELLKSNDFLVNLTRCRVKTFDGAVDTTYYNYLDKHRKRNPLLAPVGWVRRLFAKKRAATGSDTLDLFRLTKEQDGVFSTIADNVSCSSDLKTGLLTITVHDQDPLVAATIANATCMKLQDFITRYRTKKATNDLRYYTHLAAEAKADYENARRHYAGFSDSNREAVLTTVTSKKNELDNEMQLKSQAYAMISTQLQNAQAKIQERTPAFTVVRSASVPLKPDSPKRVAFVAIMIILSWIGTTIFVCRDLFAELLSRND